MRHGTHTHTAGHLKRKSFKIKDNKMGWKCFMVSLVLDSKPFFFKRVYSKNGSHWLFLNELHRNITVRASKLYPYLTKTHFSRQLDRGWVQPTYNQSVFSVNFTQDFFFCLLLILPVYKMMMGHVLILQKSVRHLWCKKKKLNWKVNIYSLLILIKCKYRCFQM